MVEEQVEVVLLPPDLKRVLAADEGEAHAKFKEEVTDVRDERLVDLPFGGTGTEGEEVEDVRVLDRLPGEVELRGRQGLDEVHDGQVLAFMEPALDLEDEDVPAPAVLDGFTDVILTQRRLADLIE